MPELTTLTKENCDFFTHRLSMIKKTVKIIGDLQQMFLDRDAYNAIHPAHEMLHEPTHQEAWQEANRVLTAEVLGKPFSMDRLIALIALMQTPLPPIGEPVTPQPSTLNPPE